MSGHRISSDKLRLVFVALCLLTATVVTTILISSVTQIKTVGIKAFNTEFQLKFGAALESNTQDDSEETGSQEDTDPRQVQTPSTTTARKTPKTETPRKAIPATHKTATVKPSKMATVRKEGRKRYIIFQCDHTRWCGGLGDRQRGLISTFVLAQTLNRTFGINMTTPCNLNLFVRPNAVQWDIDPTELRGLSERTLDTFNKNNDLYPAIINGTVDTIFTEDILRIKTNGDLLNQIKRNARLTKLLPKWVDPANHTTEMHTGWKLLAKPTEHILAHYKDMFRKVKGPDNDKDLICAHVRVARNPTIPNDGESRFAIREMELLWTFVEPYVQNGTYFFLATDSEQVRNIARARFESKLIDTNGKILHIDRQRGNSEACDAFELAILEQFILSTCKRLIACQSNFSRRALEFRGSTKDLFFFSRKGVRKLTAI